MSGTELPSWRRGRGRLAICPIGWINPFLGWGESGAEQVMQQISALGYAASENSAAYPRDPQQLRDQLQRHGLKLSAAYSWVTLVHGEVLEQQISAAKAHVEFCAAAGAEVVNVAEAGHSIWDATGPRQHVTPLSDRQWRRLAAALNEVGEHARQLGVTLAVHPHGGTAVETPDETARLFASTDPALVGYCLDSGHVVYGGGDVGKVAVELAHRVVYVHLKDYRQEVLAALRANAPRADTPTGRALSLTSLGVSFEAAARAHLFCPPGQGNLEFGPLLDALRAARYDGWYVVEAEQDPQLHDPYAAGAAAREFLTQRFGLG